jgi:hypothetical protein
MTSWLPFLRIGLLVAAISLLSCGGGGDGGSDNGPVGEGGDNGPVGEGGDNGSVDTGRQWTYMVYLGADNNLSSAGIGDIEEMGRVGSSSRMAIAVQAEFSPHYTQGVPNTNTYRLLVQSASAAENLDAATDIGDVDMGSRAALTGFIQWATSTYPAQHYALVLWDHGAGWKDRARGTNSSLFRGAIQDETSGSFMSLSDLAGAIQDAGVHLDLINFDACLMAMYEVAYEFSGLADYLVFSEETEPGDGDPYDTILADLAADPAMSAADLAAVIVNRYDEFYVPYLQEYPGELTTKSAVEMSRLAALDNAVCALGKALMDDGNANTVAMAARTNTQEYAYTANHDLYDLASYINQNAPDGDAKDAAADVMAAVATMVTANAANPNADETQNVGLAIYFPEPSETSSSELNEYSQLACNTDARQSVAGSWGEYVEWEIDQGGGGSATYGPGGYNLRIEWATPSGGDCDADLDLWVAENGVFYAPWQGQTTPNGYFSQDSADSGDSSEYYQANQQVETGHYDFIVRYYEDGATCNQAEVELFFNDVSKGTAIMDLSNTYSGSGDSYNCDDILSLSNWLKCMSNYSDYVYLGYLEITANAALQLKQEARDTDIPSIKYIKQLDLMRKFK